MRYPALLALLLSLLVAPVAAEELLVPCLDCHQASTRLGEVPLIAGQHAGYLTTQLQRFRDRHRSSFPMDSMAGGLDDAALASTVAEIAGRPWSSWPAQPFEGEEQVLARGSELARRFDCVACHGTGFAGGDQIPRLAGQRPGYLAQQIAGFTGGDRHHPPTGTGAPIAAMDASEREALALWLSRLP